MTLTDQELAYLRRFCWELHYLPYGSRPTEAMCPGHYGDLCDLAHASGVAPEVLAHHDQEGDPAPPEVPCPWVPLDLLTQRASEARQVFPEKF